MTAMSDAPGAPSDDAPNKFTQAALERHKREGMELAVRARWAALAVIAVMAVVINFQVEVLYYHGVIALMALNGWLQRRVARVGQSRVEVALIAVDIGLMTVALMGPNPLSDNEFPLALQYRGGGFVYFFLFLGFGSLAYTYRTIRGIGSFVCAFWLIALGLIWWFDAPRPDLSEAALAAFGPVMGQYLDPTNLLFYIRVQELVIMMIVALTLSLLVQRQGDLLLGHAALERERANLARYFSPNVVEELSQNDEPLKSVRTQNVAVLFVDIVGFTKYASETTEAEVINTLRLFHQRMGDEVFRHQGTLDKYLGDGLMATFGTPVATESDALNALRCARAMITAAAVWNKERAAKGQPELRVSFGLHYGPAVMGDIGSGRLEFAVIGNTVNVASRVEALTRDLDVDLAATEALLDQVRREGGDDASLNGLNPREGVEIRGLPDRMTLWTHSFGAA